MTSSVYVASAEGFTGKSTVALGVLEQLARVAKTVGVFRPILRASSERDYVLDLLTSREAVPLDYADCVGVTYEEVHADPESAMSRIVDRYHQVAAQCDAVVVVGSDYTDVAAPTEFSYNARIAANLGAPVLLVVNGAGRSAAQVSTVTAVLVEELNAWHAGLLAVITNRIDQYDVPEHARQHSEVFGVPVFGIPDEPLLSAPTLAELMTGCQGTLLRGDPELLHREVSGLIVAAMTLPNVLDRLVEGAAVITREIGGKSSWACSTHMSPPTFRNCPGSFSTAASRCPTKSLDSLTDLARPCRSSPLSWAPMRRPLH